MNVKRVTRAACVAIAAALANDVRAQDTATSITYQGVLESAGEPYTGLADMEFRLFDALVGGSQVGFTSFENEVPIDDGLFEVSLEFQGAAPFAGEERYLEVEITPDGGSPIVLSPRQAVRPAPIALQAAAAQLQSDGSVIFQRDGEGDRQIVAQVFPSPVTYSPATTVWQSFTPDVSGTLDQVQIQVVKQAGVTASASWVFYEGEGTEGTPQALAPLEGIPSGASGVINLATSTAFKRLEAGQTYTVEVNLTNLTVANGSNAYDGGRSNFGPDNDLQFVAIVAGLSQPRSFLDRFARLNAGGAYLGDQQFGPTSGATVTIAADEPTMWLYDTANSDFTVRARFGEPGSIPIDSWDFFLLPNSFQAAQRDAKGTNGIFQFEADPVRVGIGESEPIATVHIKEQFNNVGLDDLNGETVVVEDEDAIVGLYSTTSGTYGSGVVLGEVSGANVQNKWSMVRRTGVGGDDLEFRFGSAVNYANNPNRFVIEDDGDARLAGQLTQNSSGALKHDVEQIRGAIDTLLKLRGVRYEWNESDRADIGFIAEEMAVVLPEIVGYDNDGTPNGIDYGRVTALLVEAVREQQSALESLAERVQAIEDGRR